MGQTDSQFKAFIRLMLKVVKEIRSEPDQKKQNEKIDELIVILQNTLED